MTKQALRNLDDVEEDFFRKHPEEMDAYIKEIFADYALTACWSKSKTGAKHPLITSATRKAA